MRQRKGEEEMIAGMAQGVDVRALRHLARHDRLREGPLQRRRMKMTLGRHPAPALAPRRWRGEEPAGIPVGAPVSTEQLEHRGGEWHHAVDAALAAANVEAASRPVDVLHVEGDPFEQPEATAVDRREARAVGGDTHGGEHAADFLATQDDGKLLVAFRPGEIEDRPASPQGLLIEEPQPGERLRDTRRRQPRAQLQEIGPELVLGQPIRRGMVEVREPRDDADVRGNRPVGVAAKSQILDQALAQRSHTILSGRS
jgi:hypothetical protein